MVVGEESSVDSDPTCGAVSATGSVGMSAVSELELCDCELSDRAETASEVSVAPVKVSAKMKLMTQVVFLVIRQSISLSKTLDQQLISETWRTSTCGMKVGRVAGRRDTEGKRA